MVDIVIPGTKDKIKRQIEALEWQIKNDLNEKDRDIHIKSLKALKTALNNIE
jgi:2C-methyl-D-erythritol 2,4-cyclodiphosphate synthase